MRNLILVIMCLYLCGCASMPKFPTLSAPEKPRTVYNWNEEVVTEPKIVKLESGEVVVQRTEKRLSAGLDTTPRKVGFQERIAGFIGGLSFWIFAIIFLGLILAPSATIGFLFNKYRQYKQAMRETVAAIKDVKGDETVALHDALSKKQTAATKQIVGKLKAGL